LFLGSLLTKQETIFLDMKSTFETRVQEGQDLPVWVAALVAILLMVIAAGCKRQGGHAQQAPPPPTVVVAPVEQRKIVDWDEFSGRTAPIDFVEVRPRTSGHVQEIRFKAGQMVKKGVVIALSGGAKGTAGAGNSTGAHLHYEVRRDGKPVDPGTLQTARVSPRGAPRTPPAAGEMK
jgi:hypothetical protein